MTLLIADQILQAVIVDVIEWQQCHATLWMQSSHNLTQTPEMPGTESSQSCIQNECVIEQLVDELDDTFWRFSLDPPNCMGHCGSWPDPFPSVIQVLWKFVKYPIEVPSNNLKRSVREKKVPDEVKTETRRSERRTVA